MALKCALLVTVVTVGAMAVPFEYGESRVNCATSCQGSMTKFQWNVGKTYEYQYESDVRTLIAGIMQDHSSLHVRAKALIEVLAPCEMALRLSDVSLEDSSQPQRGSRRTVERSSEFKEALERRPLRFAFQDGIIESVCPEDGEETWVLNVKRGIVSAIQNTQSRLDASMVTVETDIAGTCPVEYEVEGSSWGTKTIKKTKDLLGCTERIGHFTTFQSTPYNVDSAIQTMPVMKSTHECRQQISKGILTETACTELHVFRPFSKGNNGAVTEVSYKMSFQKESTGVSTGQGAVAKTSSLIFEHEINHEEMRTTARDAKQSLEMLCRLSKDEISAEVPRLFRQLVYQLRRLNSDTLQAFYRSATGTCDKAPKFIRDAIPVIGTSASLRLMRDLIVDGEVIENEADTWISSLAFVASPTRDMLAAVKPLLNRNRHLRKSALAISTMVHKYCRRNGNCASEPEVDDILRTLEENLRYNCKAQSSEQHDLILMSLKAIGNAGHAVRAASTINRCFRNQELPMEIRVAALQALRRMSCQADLNDVKELLASDLEDSELRIHAYLILMKCPSQAILQYVQKILIKEEVNQVGSFIWTHLTNLMETANPHKQDVKRVLQDVELKKKFDLDKRKFSRNIELSAFSKLINVGGMAEGNLIWSEKSFVPRSASVNMTVELFGESVNLLEIGVRAQGLEKMIEKLFAKHDNAVERGKRAADVIAKMDRQYDGRRDAPQASYYIRVFGNEISYDDFHDFDLDTIKGKLNYLDWLIDLSMEHSVEQTRSMLFLDSSMVVPTAAGLPLRLKVDGTSSVTISVSGKVDIRQLFSSNSIFNIDGAVKPSGSMEINGEMGIDAHVAQTGIKMKTTLHSSTVAEGKIQMKNGKIFKLDIKAPEDNTEIISAESKFFVINRGQEMEPKMLDVKRIAENVCTGDGFDTVTGLQLCAQFSSPCPSNKENMPWAIITGPASASLILNKKDTQTNYVVEANLIMDSDQIPGITPGASNIHFYADTPGSRTNRKILVDVTLDRENSRVSLDLNTPWKMAKFEGELTNTNQMKRVMTRATLDGKDEYLLDAELGYDKRSYISQYTPKLEIRTPGRDRILLSGELKHRPGKKSVFSVVLRNAFREPIKASGSLVAVNEPSQMRYETDLEFSSELINGKVNAFIDNAEDEARTLSSKVEAEYTLGKGPRQRAQFEYQIVDSSKYNTHSYSLVSSWSSTLAERYNGDIRTDFVMDSESLRIGINGGFDQKRRITFIETATFKFGREQEINMDMSLLVPYKDIDYTGKVEYLRNDDEFKVLGNSKGFANKEASFTMIAKRNSRKPLNVMIEGTMTYPGRDIAISGSVEERAVGVYSQRLNLQLQKYENIIVNSVYKTGPRHELTADITVPHFPKIAIKGHLKPDLTDLQAGCEVLYGDRTYMTDVNLLRRGKGRSFSIESTAEVAYPERRILAQGAASRQGSEVVSNAELKWDARNDEGKKFAMLAKINVEPSAPAADVQISAYPQHFVNLQTNGKYERGGWYKSDTDVEGRFALQSSFPNFEDIGASFQHDRTPKGYRNSGEISWQKGRKITGLLNLKKRDSWSNGQVDVEMSTPFRGARRMNAEIGYNIQDTRLSANAKAQLENKQMTLALNGQLIPDQHRLSGDIAFTSPYASLRSVTASVRHNDDGQKYESSLTTSWAPGKQISADFNMEHRGGIFDASNNGKLSLTTPFPGYEQVHASWQHAHNSNGLENAVQVEREGRPVYSHSAVANAKRTGSKFQADVQASLKASNMNEMSLTVDHSHDPKKLETMNSACSFSWAPAKTILLSYDVDRTGDKLMWLSGRLQTPFRGFENLSMKSNTNKNGNMALSSNEVKWGASRKITLETEAKVRGYEFEIQSHLTTPFAAAQNLVINVQNHREDGIWKTHAELDYGKRIELDMELTGNSKKMISMHLRSPCPYLRDVYAKAEIDGVSRNFIYNAEIRHDQLTDKIKMNGIVNMSDMKNIKVTANVKTPFEAVRYLKLTINQNIGKDSIHLDATIQHPSYKSRLTEDISYKAGTFITTKTIVEYLEGKAIEVDANLRIKPKMSAEILLKSPFEHYREIKLMLSHELSLSGFSTIGELSYGPRDQINANVNYYKTGNIITGTVELATPFQAIKRMALVVNHEGSLQEFRDDVKFELNGMQISGKSEFTMAGDSLGLKMEVQTPVVGYESITVDVSHRGPITNFRNNLRITIGSTEVVSSGQFKIGRSSLTGSLDLRLPFNALHSVGLIIDHSGSLADCTDKFVLAYNSKKILVKSTVKLIGSSLTGKMSVKTPFQMLRSMAVVIRHEGPLDNFKNDVVITLNDKDLTADSQLLLGGNSMAATANVALPNHIGSLEVSHEGPITNFRNAALLKYNGVSYRGESQFAKGGDAMSGRLAYSYPSNAVSAEFNHRGMATNFNNDMTLMYGEKKMEGGSKFKWHGNAMTAEGSLNLPRNRWSIIAAHEGPLDNFKNNVDLQYNGNNIRGNSEMSISGSNLALKASLSTPYSAMKSTSVDFSHSGPLSNFNNNAALRVNDKQYTGSSEFILRGDRLNAKATIQAPETSLAGEVNHVGKLTDFKNDARLAYNGKEITGNSEFRRNGDQLNLSGRVTTPSSAMSGDFSHRGTWMNFNNNGALTVNGKRISAMSAFNRSGDDLNGEIAFDSPSKRMAIEVAHRGPITNFVTDAALAYDRQRAGGKVQFKLDDNAMNGKAMLKLPSDGTPSVQLEVNHEGPMNNFRNNFNLKFGKREIIGSGQFKHRSNRLYAMGELSLPTAGIRHVVAELTHNGRRTNFENTLQMKINDDSIKADSSFALDDAGMKAVANIQTSYNLKPISVEIYHKGQLRHFTEKAVVVYGEKRVTATAEFRLEGDALDVQGKIEPSCCVEPMAVDLMFRGPLRSFTARASANYGRYEVITSNEFSITGNALHLKSVLRSNIANLKPILVELNHKGPLMDFTNDAMIGYGSDKISGTSEFKWRGSTIHLKSTMQTTMGGLKPISIEIIHDGPIDKFKDSILMSYGNEEIKAGLEATIEDRKVMVEVELFTPFTQVQTLVGKINHNGKSWHNFENSGSLKLNNNRYTGQSEFRWFGKIFKLYAETKVPEEYSLKINHKGTMTDFSNNVKVKIPDERITGTSSLQALGNKVEGSVSLDSSIARLSNIDASFSHEGDPRKFKTSFNLRTPIRRYSAFSGELSHEGTTDGFQTSGLLNLPFTDLRQVQINAQHQRADNKHTAAGSVSYNDKTIAGELKYEKTARKMIADATLHTPYSGFETLGASMEHAGAKDNFQTNGAITTSIPGYERFTGMLSHSGDSRRFRTNAEVTTPFRKYNKFGVGVEHSGNMNNFKTSGSLTTPIPGYERLSGSLNHNGNWRAFTTNGHFQTMIPGHEVYKMAVDHNTNSGIMTSASLEYPGKKYDFRLNHRGTAKDFNTDLQIQTPHRGYEQFGVSLAHSGDLNDMTQSGTIRLPMKTIPEIKYSVSHRGIPGDFTSSGWLEYAKGRIEGSGKYKHTSSHGEDKYEGALAVGSTHAQLRDLEVKARHTNTPTRHTGTMDVSHNGEKAVDFDYDWATSGPNRVELKVRRPRPFETKVRFENAGDQFNGDAYVNLDDQFDARGELNVKNKPNDRELNLKMVLPSRTVILRSGYQNTDAGIKHSTDFQWGSGEGKKISYTLEGSMTNQRRRNAIDGRFALKSSALSGEATLNHVGAPGRQYTTEVALQTDKRMAIKSDLTLVHPRFQHLISIEHPDIPEGVTLTYGGLMDNKVYDGKIELRYKQEIITFLGRVADVSSPDSYKYESSCRLTHPGSNLDFQYFGTLINNADIGSWSMATKYMLSKTQEYITSSLRAELDKTRNEAILEVINPLYVGTLKTLRVSGHQTHSNGVYRYEGEASIEQSSISGELTLAKYKSADLIIHYNDDDYLQATAKMTSEQLKAEIFRMASGVKIQEALFLVQKEPERMLTSRIYCRPDMLSDIKSSWRTTTFGRQLNSEVQNTFSVLMEDWRAKADYARMNIQPLYRSVVAVNNMIVSVYRSAMAELEIMYERNEFYMKDIAGIVLKMNRYVRSTYAALRKSAKENYTRANAALSRSKRSLNDIMNQTWSYTEGIGTRVSSWWNHLVDTVNSTARALVDKVSSLPDLMDSISESSYNPLTYLDQEDDAAATSSVGPSYLSQLLDRDDLRTGISYLKRQIMDSELVNKYFEMKDAVEDILADIQQHGLKTIRTNIVAWAKDYLKADKDSIFIGDGEVKVSLYLPLPLDDLRTIPSVEVDFTKYLKQARDMYSKYMPKYEWTLWDYYYTYKPRGSIRDMIPPFSAHATISGNQHYMTFDKKFYEFSGECSYLLARDFIDGTFSVIVNYERTGGDRPTRKSLTLISNDKTLVISTDGTVMMDNSPVELPLQLDGVSVLREPNQIRIDNKNGIEVACDLAHNQCTVEVSGWYYGKTAGLMGTYNNEMVDDFTAVDKERLNNAGQFAASWSLGARCKPVNYAMEAGNEVVTEPQGYGICAEYFIHESSPFRKCFRIVKPEPFMKTCLSDMLVNGGETETDACDAAAFYISECQRAGVPIKIPSVCVRCEMVNGQVFSEGQNVTIRDGAVPSSADFVFVIHESECNRRMLANLKNVVDSLEKVLTAARLTNNRYAIVGYGGVTSDAHIHTIEGQVFAPASSFSLGLANVSPTAGDAEDAMAAIKYAANLPFRVGVSKTILLLPCAPCKQGQATFSELQQLLLFRDISFHVLMQYNFQFKVKRTIDNDFIFGIDHETVYTRKDAGTTELVGDAEIRSQITVPKDLCVALSEETSGSVFNTLQYTDGRPYIQKRFLDVLVRVIAENAEPSPCQICDCKPDNVGAGKADCRHCVRPNPMYEILPTFEDYPLSPSSFQMLQISELPSGKTPKKVPTKAKKSKAKKSKAKKSKAKKSKKPGKVTKRTLRQMRLERLDGQQDM